MAETEENAGLGLIDYMLAHLRVNSNTDMSDWGMTEIVQSFAILPPPKVSYVDWVASLRFLASAEEEPKPQKENVVKMDPWEDLKTNHPHLWRDGVVYLGPPQEEEKKAATA